MLDLKVRRGNVRGAARGALLSEALSSGALVLMAGAILNTLRLAKAGVVLASHSVRFVPKDGPEPLPFKLARLATLPVRALSAPFQ